MSKQKLGSLEGKIENVLLESVEVDGSYQRQVQRHHKFIVENFEKAAAGVLTVARRSDLKLYWVDGLQRATAMKKLGITHWKCLVIESCGPRFEAHLFRLLNGREGRKSLNQTQLFNAALTAEDPTALAVKRVTDSLGLVVKREGYTTGWPIVASAGLLYHTAQRQGENVLRETLELIVQTWPQVNDALHHQIIGGTLAIVAHRGDVLDKERFKQVLGNIPPKAIMMNARGMVSGAYGSVADEMILRYNKGRKGRQRLKLFREEEVA